QTYLSWADLMLEHYDYDIAVDYLLQALEFYPEHADLEYRIAGMYYMLQEPSKGDRYLKKALEHNFEAKDIIEILFPEHYNQNAVKNIIRSIQSASTKIYYICSPKSINNKAAMINSLNGYMLSR